MVTINQAIKNSRKKQIKKYSALDKCPFKKGECLRVFYLKPKKPNSAQRRVAKVKLTNNKIIFVYIPGEGFSNNIKEHSVLLVRGGRVPDLPGVKYHAVRGKQDLLPVGNRENGRSKYGKKKK